MRKKLPHLLPALAAILIFIGILAGCSLYARSLEQKDVNALASVRSTQVNVGSVLQEAAFRQPDLLPVYGSSEVYEENDENSASQFFKTYPTGFTVFEVAVSGITSLEIAQNLASLGPELKGKKVVISFTASMFTNTEVGQKAYSGDFYRLHAFEMVFSSYISYNLKQRVASRMLDYPDTYVNDPVLEFALQNLTGHSPIQFLLYYLTEPIGWLQTQIMRLQDHLEVLNWIYSNPQALLSVPHNTYSIDWKAEIANAQRLQNEVTSSNPYGIENHKWSGQNHLQVGKKIVPGSTNKYFIQKLSDSKEWEDFDIVLSILKETGAQPLILSRPLNGTMLNAVGVSSSARQVFYSRLQKTVQSY